jgi:transposase
MLTLPPSVKIYVSAQPVDARKSFDGLAALVEAEFGLEPLSGHLFVFLNRRGHVAQMLFWDRSGFCIVKKRLEAGTFKLHAVVAAGATHVQIDSAELALMLEGIELDGARRRKRYEPDAAE